MTRVSEIEAVVFSTLQPHMNNDWLVASGLCRSVALAIEGVPGLLREPQEPHGSVSDRAADVIQRLYSDWQNTPTSQTFGQYVTTVLSFEGLLSGAPLPAVSEGAPAVGDARRLLVDRLHMDRLLHLGAEIVAAKKFVAQDAEFWGGGSGRVIFAERYDDTTNAAAEALNLLIEIVTAEDKQVGP